MATVLRSKGQLTIPADVRKRAHLDEGDPVEFEVVEDGILLRPRKIIDATQAWFWKPDWQAGEREASSEVEAGLGTTFDNSEDFLRSLEP